MLETVDITCAWCWQLVPVTIDCSAGSAQLIEDCTVCCRPMLLSTTVGNDGTLQMIDAVRDND